MSKRMTKFWVMIGLVAALAMASSRVGQMDPQSELAGYWEVEYVGREARLKQISLTHH